VIRVELHIGTPSKNYHRIELAGVPRVGEVIALDVDQVGVNVRVVQVVWVANPSGNNDEAVLIATVIGAAEVSRLHLDKLG
jgi:hypothetical protein